MQAFYCKLSNASFSEEKKYAIWRHTGVLTIELYTWTQMVEYVTYVYNM